MVRTAIFCLLLILVCSLPAQQTKIPYSGIASEGEIPSDFLLLTTSKIESYKNSNKEEFKKSKDLILKSFYGLDEVLTSGRVSFGDPLSAYINRVADEVLKNQPELRQQVRIYSLKSPKINAIAAPHGFIFINTATLGYLENEAQLAYIICHEIAHIKCNHWKSTYSNNQNVIKGKGIYGSMTLDERIDVYFQRTHEIELEADSIGIELFLQTGYDPSEIVKAFNAQKFSDLPFGNKPFDIGFFNCVDFKIPAVFFKDSMARISGIENKKDEYQHHPNLYKRKEAATRIIGDKSPAGEKFLVSEDEFNKLASLSRFESVRLELLERNFTRAIYDAYLLLEEYPENKYLLISIAKALYGLTKFRNNDEFHLVTSPYSKIEGESQQLYYFLRQINPVQLNTIALKYVYELRKKFPGNRFLDLIETDLINDLVSFHKTGLGNFNDEYKEIECTGNKSLKDLKPEEILALKKKCEGFFLNAFTSEKKDSVLISKFESAEFIASQKSLKENISFREKEKQQQNYEENLRSNGFPFKFSEALVVDPVYVDLNLPTEKSIDNAEKYKMLLDEVVSEFNHDIKTPVQLLSMRHLQSNSIEDYNELCRMKELRDEILSDYKCELLPLSSVQNSGADKILICFPVILESDGLQYYYLTYYDYSTGDLVFKNKARYVTFTSIKELFRKDLQILTKN